MTPINEVPVGKFCKFGHGVVYVYKNNFKDCYGLFPVVDLIPTDKLFSYKVYVYKRVKDKWVRKAKEWLESTYRSSNGQTLYNGQGIKNLEKMDNLLYIENLDILNNYLKSVIIKSKN